MSSLLLVSSNPAHLSPLPRSQPQASIQHQCQPANDTGIIPNNCCLPRLCARRDGNYYQFNEDAWKEKVNGYDPPWGYLGKKMHNMSSFCCRGWKAPKPVFPV
ncbi:hypothetical protein FOXYSP1_02662 [Fusarium oxysporum f. sp. phaseoli]